MNDTIYCGNVKCDPFQSSNYNNDSYPCYIEEDELLYYPPPSPQVESISEDDLRIIEIYFSKQPKLLYQSTKDVQPQDSIKQMKNKIKKVKSKVSKVFVESKFVIPSTQVKLLCEGRLLFSIKKI